MRLPPITLAIIRNRNKLAFVVVFAAITVFLIITTLSLTQYVAKTDIRAWSDILQKVTVLVPTVNEISEETFQSLSKEEGVEGIIPFFDNGIRMPGVLASEYRPVIALRPADVPFFLNAFDLHLIEGDLPTSGSREIVISEDILVTRGLEVGDNIGNAIDDQEILWGRFTISGVLDNTVSLGITSYEYYQSRGIIGNSILLFSSLDISELNQMLEPYTGQLNVENFDTFMVRHHEEYRNFERLMIILAVILIASAQVVLTIFIYLYLASRKKEFGLFLFRGISTSRIALFVICELALVAVCSWVSGLILSVAVLRFIRTVLFDEGVISVTVSTQSVLLTVPMVISFVLISGLLVLYIISRDKLESTMIGG